MWHPILLILIAFILIHFSERKKEITMKDKYKEKNLP